MTTTPDPDESGFPPDQTTPLPGARRVDAESNLPPQTDAVFGSGASPSHEADEEDDPIEMGRYALIGSPVPGSRKPYAQGGEGRVYLAQALDGGEKVALKVPLPEFARDAVRCNRLVREAQQLQSMDHPAIVKVLDLNEDHDPPYYTMPHLAGGPLTALIQPDQPLPTAEVARVGLPLADAVRYLHDERGVSHRDIKPGNVMLDGQGAPVFIDFGLSRDNTGDEVSVVDPAIARDRSRFKVGTAMYMAPELFDGKAGSAQSDVYAFGVLLYEMATGGRPYDAPDFGLLTKKKRLEDPLPPSKAHPGIDGGLSLVIETALARRAGDRYATMEDLHEDLEAVAEGQTPLHATTRRDGSTVLPPVSTDTTPSEPSTPSGTPDAPQRNRAARLIVTLTLVAAVAAAGVYFAKSDSDAGLSTPPMPTPPQTLVDNHQPSESQRQDGRAEASSKTLNPSPLHESNGDGHKVTPPTTPEPSATTQITPSEAEIVAIRVTQALSAEAARDDSAADDLTRLFKILEKADDPDAAKDLPYTAWLHRAAAAGASQSLGVLVDHAATFGSSASARLPSGHSWLQTAVLSRETDALAQGLDEWISARTDFNHSLLKDAAVGTKAPLDLALFHKREAWAKALQAAIAASP